MSAGEVHVGDIGTVFQVTVKDETGTVVNINSMSTKKIYLTKPNGDKLTKDAVNVTDGTDGKMKYTAVTSDIDKPGTWSIQGYVSGTTGTWFTDISEFEVYPNL